MTKDVGYYTANLTHVGKEEMGTGKLDLNFVNEGKLYDTAQWDDLKSRQPFFAQINLPEAEYDIYDRKSAEKARVPWVGEEWHPKVATEKNVTPPPFYPDHPIARQEWARYLNSISGADVRIGKLLARLKADGMDDDTVVIFFSDNGRLTPRGIHWPFDQGLRVPVIARDAKLPPFLRKRKAWYSQQTGSQLVGLNCYHLGSSWHRTSIWNAEPSISRQDGRPGSQLRFCRS